MMKIAGQVIWSGKRNIDIISLFFLIQSVKICVGLRPGIARRFVAFVKDGKKGLRGAKKLVLKCLYNLWNTVSLSKEWLHHSVSLC